MFQQASEYECAFISYLAVRERHLKLIFKLENLIYIARLFSFSKING